MTEAAALGRADRALLAVCAAPDAENGDCLSALSHEDWERLLALATEQRAAPLLRRAIGRAGRAAAPPPALAAQLDAAVQRQVQTLLHQRAALAAVVARLRDAGMEPIVLKGARLAWRDYPEPVLRPLRDLDLLLPPDQVERAQALLLACGEYAMLPGARPYGIEYGHQLPELAERRSGMLIELHHRLNARGWREESGLVEMIIAGAEALDMGAGLVIQVPSAHANFLHLVEHATLHHLFDNGPLVLADLHFAASSIEWPKLLAEADALGLMRALQLIAAIVRHHGADWLPMQLASSVAVPAHLAIAEAALLRSDADRRAIARLRRLEQRTGARPGLVAGLRAALRPDPSALAGLARTGPADARRWLGYPAWLVRRVASYRRDGGGDTRARAAGHVGLHAWLHGG